MKMLFYVILTIAYFASCSATEDKKNAQVETRSATNITDAGATLWGLIIEHGSSGIKEYGMEINGKKMQHTTAKADSFGVYAYDLEMGRQYSYKAYAVDNNNVTIYGSMKEFRTHFPTVPSPLAIEVNAEQEKQVIDGFGASDGWRCQMIGQYWSETKKEAIADLLFSRETDASGNPLGIGLSIWRFNIGAGSAEQGDNSSIPDEWRRAECFQNADGTYNWTKQAGQQWFARAAKVRGVEHLLGFSISAPVHLTNNGKAFGSSGINMNIKQNAIPQFAAFLADVAQYFVQQGMPMDYLSPVNEPQWNWMPDQWGQGSQEGTPATNSEIAALVKSLNEQLVAKGLTTKISITDAGQIDYVYQQMNSEDRDDQIRRFFNSTSNCYVGNLSNVDHAISAHSYWTVWSLSDLVSKRLTLYSSLKSQNLKYWQTEYSILESPGTDQIPNGNGNKRDLGMATALFVARIIHADMTVAHASSWQWWTALSRCDYKDGLIYLDDGSDNGITGWPRPAAYCKTDGFIRPSKLLWMVGNYSYFVRPGMVRIEAASNNNPLNEINSGLMVSAYKDKTTGKIVLVCINNTNNEQRCELKLSGGITVTKLVPYITSETKNLEKQAEVDVNEFFIPARSVVTFVGER